MESLSMPWVIASLTFLAGLVVGLVLRKSGGSDMRQTEKIKTEMAALQQEFDDYKSSVSDHFNTTSELVNQLTASYVKVYQHLASGSQALSDAEKLTLKLEDEQELVSVIGKTGEAEATADSQSMEAPKDYAPKTADEGTLSESFSINSDRHTPEQTLEPAERR